MSENVKTTTKLNDIILKIASENSVKWNIPEKELAERVKKKIASNGVNRNALYKYLFQQTNPNISTANIILSTLQTFDSSIQMSDIF
jgi:hypothetical protein